MKGIIQIIAVMSAVLIGTMEGYAKTLYAIAFCNTLDKKVGKAAVVSHDMVNNELGYLSDLLGYEYKFIDYVGQDCSKENLESQISSMTSSPEDIIVFYYFGHGTRAEGQTSPFPQMCLKYESYNQDKFVPVQYVINRLKNQPAHLKLIMSMCCNNVVKGITPKNTICEAMGPTYVGNVNVENYKKLFDDFKGTLAITGSEPGQFSWCNSQYGGIFDVEFWSAMEAVGDNTIPADWDSVFKAVRVATDESAYRRTDPPTHQLPYFEIMPFKKSIDPPAPDEPKDRVKEPDVRKREEISENNSALQNAISRMLATSDVNRRIEMVNDIISYFFNGDKGVFVQLYGRNMQTIIDTMDIESYLRNIALSGKVLKVNNLGTTTINNRKVIKFHEIRK